MPLLQYLLLENTIGTSPSHELPAWLHFSSQGLVLIDYIRTTVLPANVGKRVSGELFRTVPGVTFLDTYEEIYQENEGVFYRIIGLGDRMGAEIVSYLQYRATRDNLPLRLIIEVRFASSPSMAQIIELRIETPAHCLPALVALTSIPNPEIFLFHSAT